MVLTTAFRALDWFFLGLATVFLILALWLAFSRFGKLKLGHPDDQPEFSIPSWLAILFAAGMGVGLLFWGVAEPMTHLTDAPGFEPGSPSAARQSMVISIFHWGLHAWAVYGVAALVLAFFLIPIWDSLFTGQAHSKSDVGVLGRAHGMVGRFFSDCGGGPGCRRFHWLGGVPNAEWSVCPGRV